MSYSPAQNALLAMQNAQLQQANAGQQQASTSGLAQQLGNSIPRTATGITIGNSYTITGASNQSYPAYQAVPTLSLCYGCRRECSTLKHVESKKGLWLCGDCHVKEGYEW